MSREVRVSFTFNEMLRELLLKAQEQGRLPNEHGTATGLEFIINKDTETITVLGEFTKREDKPCSPPKKQ